MAFKIKDGIRIGLVDVFNNSGVLLVSAPSLTSSRSISISGDATWTVNFDGSANATAGLTLANTSVTAGSGYNTFTVDSKGRITAASNTAYLTSESDTLASVTGRGATTSVATISLTGGTASTNTTSGTLVVTGGVGISGAIYNGGDIVSGGNHAVNGGSLTTSASSANLFNTNATTLNIGGAATTLNLGASTGNTTVGNNLIVTGNLTVNGTTETVNSTVTTIVDPIITIGGATGGGAPSSNDSKDRGIAFQWHNGTVAKIGFFGYKNADGYLEFIPDATISSEVVTGTLGDFKATNFRGALIGNADTSTKLANSRSISISGDATWTVNFDGSANATAALTLANTAVTAGSGYNTFTVDSKGRITAASTTSYLTSESDTLATVTGRGATTSTAISITNTTDSTSTSTGALQISGGVAISKSLFIAGNIVSATSGGTGISVNGSTQTTLSTTTQTAVDSWGVGTYRSAKYIIQITQGTNYQVSEMIVIQNGSTTTSTEYAVLETNGTLATFTTDINASNARLLVTMLSATSATINITKTLLTI